MNHEQLLDEHIQRVESNTTLFKETFSDISEQGLNWRPNAETWSVGLCIEHIITSNHVYFDVFEKLSKNQYKHRLYENTPFIPRLFGNLVLNACKPETKRKVKTLTVFEPDESNVDMNIMRRFVECNEQMIHYFESLKWLPNLKITVTSPASRFVIMPLTMIFDILIYHEIRHINQAEGVLTLYREHNISGVTS
jgi:uncharacterized damage-inducible protein DinB